MRAPGIEALLITHLRRSAFLAAFTVLVATSAVVAQQSAARRLQGLSGAQFEVAFLQEMIEHHQMAVQMARAARRRATTSEVSTLAQSIISQQSDEVDRMIVWLDRWHRGTSKPPDPAAMLYMAQEMAALDAATGLEFDRRFTAAMIAHHESAIEMARLVEARTASAELETLARGVISAQSREIALMRGWLRAWGPSTTLARVRWVLGTGLLAVLASGTLVWWWIRRRARMQ